MALPRAPEARYFYQAAKQRYEDATVLLAAQRTTGAIYLAGYGVECMLKAMLLAATPKGSRRQVIELFRGVKAHDFQSLSARYVNAGGRIPGVVSGAIVQVNTWAVSRRYEAGSAKYRDAESFLAAVAVIMDWADRSM